MNQPLSPTRLCPLILALLLAGCTAQLKTPYQTPAVTLPPAWEQPSGPTNPAPEHWWEGFGDPVLNRLVTEALQRNNDLAAATILVRRAQLQAQLADSDRLPGVAVQASTGISRNLGSESNETRNLAASGAVSYELDLWGKLGSTYDAARWSAQATEEDRASTALALIGTTASLYWQVAYLNQRITLSRTSIEYARRTLELVRVQKAAGAASTLEILEAERNLASQEANQTTLVQQRVEARNALAILFDGPPQPLLTREPQDLAGAELPEVETGLPAQLLQRRPDLRAAEARLRGALANTDATRASFYPSINLTGSLGDSSEDLTRLLNNPVAALTADLALPFLQWRDMQRTVKISETEYDQAILTYRQALYKALSEVENSLSARQQLRLQAEKLELTVRAAVQSEELYRIRYQAGGSPLKFWLDAQENRRQAEILLAANRLAQLQNHITLAKALGGDTAADAPPADSSR
jgi:NodT family efflux transporter outer membrane factor (OMF) lipoprotein